MCTLQHKHFASLTSWTDQLDGPAGRTSWTDQLDGPAGRISWIDQFSLLEALASSHIRRLTFQFVHCRSFRVRRRSCFSLILLLLIFVYLPRRSKAEKVFRPWWDTLEDYLLNSLVLLGKEQCCGKVWGQLASRLSFLPYIIKIIQTFDDRFKYILVV